MTRTDALLRILRDPGRKPVTTILKEVASFCAIHRETPNHYLSHMLYRKDSGDPRAYIADSEARKVHRYQRDTAIGQFFANKVLFYHHLKASGIRLPTLLGYNVGKRFFLSGESRSIETAAEFKELLRQVFPESPRIFMKPSIGAGGANVIQLSPKDLETSNFAAMHRRITSTSYIFQERVRQHPELDAYYSGSVNSMRVVTCMRDGDAEVISAVIRFGAQGNHVDNVSAGGLFVGIDLDTGRLVPPARQSFKSGGGLHLSHPDTGRSFSDFEVPYFAEVMETAIHCCRYLPYKIVGWDIAVADEGPVVIEGNDWPNLGLVQIAYGGYKSHPTLGPFVKEILASS